MTKVHRLTNRGYSCVRAKGALSTLVLCAGLASLALGCATTVPFSVLRPAKVNLKKLANNGEPSVSVGKWEAAQNEQGNYASEVGQYLREAITSAEGGVVKFAQADGTVSLEGTLTEHSHKEEVREERSQCTKYEDGKSIKYPCVIRTRTGIGRVRVSMNVLDHGGKTVSADTQDCERRPSTSATDEQPPSIDWEGVLLECRREVAANLAKNVVPYRIVVTKRWFGCGDADAACKAGLAQLRAGNFDEAALQFENALEMLKKQPKPDAEALAGAHWALTLVNEFAGEYSTAQEHLKEAINLQPENAEFVNERASIEEERRKREELEKQGVGGTQPTAEPAASTEHADASDVTSKDGTTAAAQPETH
jgi:tetratricopeptide (TPR) repeat protein